jgi:uncharacterized delta-60 repeat protein
LRVLIAGLASVLLIGSAMKLPARAAFAQDDEEVPEAAGDLDTAFGQGGKVTTTVSGDRDVGEAVAIQPDGKIVVGGVAGTSSGNDSANFGLARFNADGSLDTSFGTGGKVTTDFYNHFDVIFQLVIQPDGKILAAGTVHSLLSGGVDQPGIGVARYNTDGTLDSSFAQGEFGGGGKSATFVLNAQAWGYAIALQPDGKIVVAGSTGKLGDDTTLTFTLIRLNSDGTLDTSFGGGTGRPIVQFGHRSEAFAVAIQPDDKILACGYAQSGATPVSDSSQFAIARLNTDGSLDTTFGSGGKVTTDFLGHNAFAQGVAIQPDGKIVLAGEAQSSSDLSSGDFALARYNANGSLDTSFGGGQGKVRTDFGGFFDKAEGLAIQPDGKIVAGGESWTGTTVSTSRFALARYLADGSLDTTLGSGGKVTTTFSGNGDVGRALALQQDGSIVMAGGSMVSATQNDFGLARYQADSGFSLGFAQSTVTGSAGTKVRVVININRTGGFAGNVTIDATSLPAGIKPKPPLPISTTDTSAAVKLKIGAAAATGTYHIVFTGTDDAGRARSGTLTLIVQ